MVDDSGARLVMSFSSENLSVELVGGEHEDGTETYDLISYSNDQSPVCHNTFTSREEGIQAHKNMVAEFTKNQAQ